jgi:hypothetical protein
MRQGIGQLLKRAAEWLEDFSEPGTGTPAGAGAGAGTRYARSDSAKRLDPTDDEGFNRRLQEFRARHRTAIKALMTGTVQILGLTELQRRYGPRWDDMRHMALRLAETSIENRLGPLDLYLVVNEEHFVILFGNASREEAERRARLIASDILTKLCGNHAWGASITVRGFAVKVDKSLTPEDIADFDHLVGCIREAEEAGIAAEDRFFRDFAETVGIAWRPTLNAAKKLVSAYGLGLTSVDGEGRRVPAISARPPDVSERFLVTLDTLALERLADYFTTEAGTAARSLLLVPVHWETLSVRAHREAYVAAFRAFPPATRRRLIPEIVDLPAGTPQSRLREVVQPVWPMTMGLACRTGLTPRDALDLTGAGLVILSADGSQLTDADAATRKRLAIYSSWAREAGFRPMLSNVGSVAVAHAAVKAGFEYVNGDAFLGATSDPNQVYAMPAV